MKKTLRNIFLAVGSIIVLFVSYFYIIQRLDKKALEQGEGRAVQTNSGQPTLLPSLFIGDRFYVKMATEGSDTLRAFGDSGGGTCMMMPKTAEKAAIKDKVHSAWVRGVLPVHYASFAAVVTDKRIPAPMPGHMILRRWMQRVDEPFFVVPPQDEELKMMEQSMDQLDLFLGQNFFMGQSWTIDYPQQQLWINTPLSAVDEGVPNVQRLGFQRNAAGKAVFGHPRMHIVVDGEEIDMLFDTGASLVLSENGKKVFNTNEKTLGGSFIATSVFDKWRKTHPEWKYYEKADLAGDVIEVPVVKIGGYEVGPVLFAKRADEAWSKGMIQTMDSVVRGAIGGSALKFFKVTIDYNSALIKFEK